MLASTVNQSNTTECKHCGKEMNVSSSRNAFCCAGCESVYTILQNSGLSHFYELKKDGVCFTQNAQPVQNKTDYSTWDDHQNLAEQNFKNEYELYIEGIHCSACVWLLEQLPIILPQDAYTCSLDIGKSILTVSLRPGAKISTIGAQIAKWGYIPHLIETSDRGKELLTLENQKRLSELGIAGALAGNIMLMSIPLYAGISGDFQILFEWISATLAIPALFVSGRSFFKNVISGFRNKTFPIDAPILLALVVAFGYSWVSLVTHTHDLYFDSLSVLIFLLLSSRYYLARIRQSSILSLGTLDFFKAKFKGEVGSIATLSADEEVSFDGVIRQGELWVDSSKFTGESLPVQLKAGDFIYSGSRIVNASPQNKIEVLKVGEKTRLAELLKKVEQTQKIKTSTEILSDQLAKKLLAVVTTVGITSFLYFLQAGIPLKESITRLLALLIVTCPCALALATPLVFSLAMKTLLKKGVLVKDPKSLDQILVEKNIYFDKTGTLTEGQLEITTDLSQLPQKTKSVLYSLALSSGHPVSRAIQFYFSNSQMPIPVVTFQSVEEKIGQGLFANLNGITYQLVRAPHAHSQQTEVCLYEDHQEIARVSLKDRVRSDSKKTIQVLKKLGYHPAILSGDHAKSAQEVGNLLEINYVFAELSPEGKAAYAKNGIMVGDGFNDALSLSSANVSVAVQGGMEAAIRSSQIYTLKPGIHGLIDVITVAKQVKSIIKTNFIVSTTYNLIGATLSIAGFMSPLIAAVLMPLSALSVFTYSLWKFKRI